MFKHFSGYIIILTTLCLLLSPTELAASENNENVYQNNEILNEVVKARVISIKDLEVPEEHRLFVTRSQLAKVEIIDKPYKGTILEIQHETSANKANAFDIFKGDKVLLLLDLEQDGSITAGYISDFSRDGYLFALIALFILCLLAFGKFKGFKALLTLIMAVLAIVKIIIPAILNGQDPVWVTVLVAVGISAITLFLISGFNRKSLAALLGTTGGVIIAGICASAVIFLGRLNGLSDEEAQMLQFLPQKIDFNFQGLLFAGMIIGALGAIMDVGVSIASSVAEVNKANPALTKWQLTKAGLNVGRDIIGTMSNTLLLAYSGGALPLLLLIAAYQQSWTSMINMEMIAIEVVRAVSGSIGLTLAAPLTAVIAAYLYKSKTNQRKITVPENEINKGVNI